MVEDIEYVKAGAIGLGASWDDIIIIRNGDIKQFEEEMRKLFDLVSENRDKGEETYIHINFSGHAIIRDGFTQVVCNVESDQEEPLYNLEKNIRLLSEEEGVFVTSLFVCSRENRRQDLIIQEEVDIHEAGVNRNQNLIMIFSCEQGSKAIGNT